MKLELSLQFFEEKKSPNTNFHKNPSSGSRVSPCGRTDITKLIVACCNFASLLDVSKFAQNMFRLKQAIFK